MKTFSSVLPFALAATLGSSAFAFSLSGTVKNEAGEPIKDAQVTLVKHAQSTLTDADGIFSFLNGAGLASSQSIGFININNGVLQYSQSTREPVQVRIFDMMGNQVLNKTFNGSGSFDLRQGVSAQGTYFARVRVGNADQFIKFTAKGNYSSAKSAAGHALNKLQNANSDNLTVVAAGYDTLKVFLANLDTVVALTVKKALGTDPSANPGDSAAVTPTPGGDTPATDTSAALNPGEQTYAFGYALKNAPRPSKGCGKDATLKGTVPWQCDGSEGGSCNNDAQQFSIQVAASGENRTYYMTFPKNYDKTKPYKLLVANHCMGSSSNHIATWINVNQDHPSPYYGQLEQDKEGNYIFVAPQGDGSGMWTKGEADHQFIDALLTHIEDNYCIDTSRVFATGFSFGAMFSNSLAQSFQHRLRAVAVYAVADYNIYLPDNAGKPIAWMGVHGTSDGMCDYNRAKNSAVKRILKNNGPDGTDVSSEDVPAFNGGSHVCYDFKNVDQRFPVKFCSWGGGHQWTANDDGNWHNSWVPGVAHEFFEQF